MESSFKCDICFELCIGETALADRRPMIVCGNGHSLCAECATKLKDGEDAKCPTCRSPMLADLIVNRAVLTMVENHVDRVDRVPEIDINDLKMSSEAFANGAFADVYYAKWHTQDVVVKALRPMKEISDQLKQLKLEANLAIGLHHPNIIRLFGVTKLKDNRFAVIMEKADNGSLEQILYNVEFQLAVKISLGIVDGLDFLHSRKVVHRDLKPQNVLLVGPEKISKISDFGTSKIIQTLITNSAMVGTPKYAAPELLEPGSLYGCSADVFSLAIILFEIFSGKHAETGLGTNVMQIMMAIVKGKRPAFPNNYPSNIRPLVERGWSGDPSARPKLLEFRSVLQSVKVPERTTSVKQTDIRVSLIQQSSEVAKQNLPASMISLKWNTACELLNSREMRMEMTKNIESKSNMASIINVSVLRAMEMTPRHLFIDEQRLSTKSIKATDNEIVAAAYLYNKPIPATPNSNESSPEIIGTQLSLTEIVQGQAVLLVGIKGGYIQSLVAQLVGFHGSVVTVTAEATAMVLCQDRVNFHCPLKGIIQWVKVDNIKDQPTIVAEMQKRKMLFHTIIYCGSVDHFPNEINAVLHSVGKVSIMAPVKTNGNSQQFQLFVRNGDKKELRTITDFGVIFEEIH